MAVTNGYVDGQDNSHGMAARLSCHEAVIVEGRYDQSKLISFLDALIVTTDGFGSYKGHEKREYIRRLARERGVVILTDSDAAGFQIRAYLAGFLPPEQVKHAYLPDAYGKERRKAAPSAEGKLGAEGMDAKTLLRALHCAGACLEVEEAPGKCWPPELSPSIVMQCLYTDGFVGRSDSRARRGELLWHLGLPERMTTKALLRYMSHAVSRADYEEALCKIAEKGRNKACISAGDMVL